MAMAQQPPPYAQQNPQDPQYPQYGQQQQQPFLQQQQQPQQPAPVPYAIQPPTTMMPAGLTEEQMRQRQADIDALVRRHELRPQLATDLVNTLSHVRVVMIVDDSGSMQLQEAPERPMPGAAAPVPTGPITRWSEAVQNTAMVCEFVFTICHHPVDVYFLNRPKVVGAKSNADLAQSFSYPPSGSTPLTARFNEVVRDYAWTQQTNQTTLVLIFTDGEPDESKDVFGGALMSKPPNFHVCVVECTDDDDTMAYIDGWKGQIPNFDGIDHYSTEVQKVKRAQGQNFPFSRSDYVALILLGTFLRYYFYVDGSAINNQGCCVIL